MRLTLLLLALQESAGAPPAGYTLPPRPVSERIVADCRSGLRPGEIVVCGRRSDEQRYREPPLPEGVEPPQRIGRDFGNARVEPGMDQVQFSNGMVSKRAVIKVTIPF